MMTQSEFATLLDKIQEQEREVRAAGQREWKVLPEFEDYRVSSAGDFCRGDRLLKQSINVATGYLMVHIDRKTYYSHSLVARAFHGPRPAGLDVNHINHVRTDNRAINLEYVDRKANMLHAARHGRLESRLTEDDVREIRKLRENGLSLQRLANQFSVAKGTITFITTNKTWKWVTP